MRAPVSPLKKPLLRRRRGCDWRKKASGLGRLIANSQIWRHTLLSLRTHTSKALAPASSDSLSLSLLSLSPTLTMSEQQLPAVEQPATSDPSELEKKKENAPQPNAGFYKSLLYQHAQRLSKQPPFYQTVNEGAQHKPQFRSRVWLDDVCYTSTNTYTQRKAAETDVSKVAFIAITQKTKDEAANLVRQVTIFSKSILTEYAVRMNLEKPSYQIIQPDASTRFASSLVFDGNTYTGEFARSKLEAQRLAARAVILSIIDSESGNVMSEIVQSKFKMIYAALDKAKSLVNSQMGSMPGGVNTGNDSDIQLSKASEMEVAAGTNGMPTPSTITEPCPVQPTSMPGTHLSLQVTQPPMPVTATAVVSHPVTSVPPILEQTPLVDSTIGVVSPPITSLPPVLEQTPLAILTSAKKRNRKNKKKAQKKARVEAQLPVDVALSAPMAQ